MLDLIAKIDEILPQTQCTRCGYPSCYAYAEALAKGAADINQCPPGGDEGIEQLAQLLKRPLKPLNPENGTLKPRQLAIIDEDVCIGCTLCIKACPVDAIIGTNKMMHTVIATECTGCDLCIPACPVDCISMIDDPNQEWDNTRRDAAKLRFDARNKRRDEERLAKELRLMEQAKLLKKARGAPEEGANNPDKSDLISQIMAKAKQKN